VPEKPAQAPCFGIAKK